jgi:hypothetical protein
MQHHLQHHIQFQMEMMKKIQLIHFLLVQIIHYQIQIKQLNNKYKLNKQIFFNKQPIENIKIL